MSQPAIGALSAAAPGVPTVASNGEVALAVWTDDRSGGRALYAARIDRSGRVLDPLGILVREPPPSGDQWRGVIWNGTHFVVFTDEPIVGPVATFISVDGRIVDRRVIGLPRGYSFEHAAKQGPEARVLLLKRPGFYDGRAFKMAIVDGEGRVLVSPRALPDPPANGYADEQPAAADNGREFLILRRTAAYYPQPDKIVATRIAFEGDILSSNEIAVDQLRGGRFGPVEGAESGGYAFINTASDGRRLHRLDASAAVVSSELLAGAGGNATIVRDGDGFLVLSSYGASATTNTPGMTVAIRVPASGSPQAPREIWRWTGFGNTFVAATTANGFRVAFTVARNRDDSHPGLFAHLLTPALDPAPPIRVTYSAAAQSVDAVMATSQGYATYFHEAAGDLCRYFESRSDGQVQALFDASCYPSAFRAASNGETSLVMHSAARVGGSPSLFLRRRNVSTGEWYDLQNIEADTSSDYLETPEAAVASNGADFLFVWRYEEELHAWRIAPDGGPYRYRDVVLSTAEANPRSRPGDPAVASNGSDYLVVWSEAPPCDSWCQDPYEIRALRLRADGTALDAAPLVLQKSDRSSPRNRPTVAWNTGRYVVAWTAGNVIHGASISPEGAILEQGVTLSRPAGPEEVLTAKLVPHESGFVLFTRRTIWVQSGVVVWEAVVFDDLRRAADRSPIVVGGGEGWSNSFLEAASIGGSLVIARDRLAGPETGRVPRVFVGLFDTITGPRRRSVRQ